MKYWLIFIVLLMCILGVVSGVPLYKELTMSLQVEVQEGPKTVVESNCKLDATVVEEIAKRLQEAGINKEPLLGDTGVSRHLQRLEHKKTDIHELRQYTKDLQYLNEYTTVRNASIPSSFWDVCTVEMENKNWTEYSLVHQLVQPEWEAYLQLLTQAYGRFIQFKAAEAKGIDTALDTALDMFAMVEGYYHEIPFSSLTEHAKEIKGETEAVLMIWQSLVAGSSRVNPLTHKPLFSHSIFARNNVGTIYQYDQGREMSTGKVWGVSGFASKFVGIPNNSNQVEHMSISMVVQLVMSEPVAVLDGIEEEKLLLGHAPSEESHADMALNNAIHKEFVPYFRESRLGAVENLRRALKKQL
jgi:hypothetical protein